MGLFDVFKINKLKSEIDTLTSERDALKAKKAQVESLLTPELKDVVSEGLARCSENCGHKYNEGQGYVVTVCGTNFEKICGCCTVRFRNPDEATIKMIKEVIQKRNQK